LEIGANGILSGIKTLAIDKNNILYVSNDIYPDSKVLRWNGNAWNQIGGLFTYPNTSSSITTDNNSSIYSSSNGSFSVAKWNGLTWTEIGPGANALNASNIIIKLCNDPIGNIYAGGRFNIYNGDSLGVAKWNGNSWLKIGNAIGRGSVNLITALCVGVNGNIYVTGDFTNANGSPYVAVFRQ